jgi:hypothetical protein
LAAISFKVTLGAAAGALAAGALAAGALAAGLGAAGAAGAAVGSEPPQAARITANIASNKNTNMPFRIFFPHRIEIYL